ARVSRGRHPAAGPAGHGHRGQDHGPHHLRSPRSSRPRQGGQGGVQPHVIFHDYYSKIPAEEIDRFIAAQEMGRLVTLGEDGTPHLGLYNFVYAPPTLELHLVRTDEQAADLQARSRCAFEGDGRLPAVPSPRSPPETGGSATSYHRTVIFA